MIFGFDKRIEWALLLCAALFLLPGAVSAADEDPEPPAVYNLFFLHHSTGRNLVEQGDVRDLLAAKSAADGVVYEFWDHDYNRYPLRLPDGSIGIWNYDIPNDNTDPDGLYYLWTSASTDAAATRDSILTNHRVIAFKSCYPASNIASDSDLAQRKQWYTEMRDVFDTHPDHIFLVMSQPPLHPEATNLANADRARAFADWLGSDEYLQDHPNVVCFDFFASLAHPDDGSADRNTLRSEYRREYVDSHPNTTANIAVAPLFVDALVAAARLLDPSPPPPEGTSWGTVKGLFSK